MKLLRHLLAVCVAVALVIGLGYLWSHSSAAGIVADGGHDRHDRSFAPSPAGQSATGQDVGPDRREQRGAHGLSLSNISDVIQTLVILGLFLGGVVTVDKLRRSRNSPRIPTAAGGGRPSTAAQADG